MVKMSKRILATLLLVTATTCVAFGAKYTVNTSGTVKNQAGTVITSPANSVNQNYYHQTNPVTYPAQSYPASTGTMTQSYSSSPSAQSTQIIENYFNNYQAQNYIASNQVNATPVEIIEFVMDYSGSMSNWIEVAKRSMAAILAQIQPSTKVGFRVFGHDNHGNNPSTINTVRDVKKIVKNGNKFK